MKYFHTKLLVVLAITVTACTGIDKELIPPLLPVEDFFRNPDYGNVKYSPDGEKISFLTSWKNRMNIHVKFIKQDTIIRVTESAERDISDYFWINNERLGYVQDTNGDENFKLFGINLDGSDFKSLTPYENVKVEIINDLPENENEIIIGLNKRNPQLFDAYRLNVYSGQLKMVGQNPGNISVWIPDHKGSVRLAIATDQVSQTILYRPTEDTPFKLVMTSNFKESVIPFIFTADNQNVYAASNKGYDRMALILMDPESGEKKEEIFVHPEVDIQGVVWSEKQKKMQGVSFVTTKKQFFFFDNQRRQVQDKLEGLLSGYEVELVSWNREETKAIVRTYSDRSLGAYYNYDLKKDELTPLVDVSPWLKEADMAKVTPISFYSRDSLLIHGYLTLPKGINSKNLPVVVHPHGGPWVRDTWGFNSVVQFLSNRGYAVLQVNYRGSTGYGKSFHQAGFKEWGQKMQDDITDGVYWLIKEGIADPKRIGIYGASFGGYAALAGLAFTPELYTCGVSYVGPSNLFTFLESIPPYWEQYRSMLYEMVGDPVADSLMLRDASPIFHVNQMKAPLLIAHGAQDPRVKQSESEQMVKALRERGIAVTYILKEDEGHGFSKEENRFEFYLAMERFFSDHLGGNLFTIEKLE